MNEPQCVWRNRKSSLSSHSPCSLFPPPHYLSPSLIPLLPLSISCAPFSTYLLTLSFLLDDCEHFLSTAELLPPLLSSQLDSPLISIPTSARTPYSPRSLNSCKFSNYCAHISVRHPKNWNVSANSRKQFLYKVKLFLFCVIHAATRVDAQIKHGQSFKSVRSAYVEVQPADAVLSFQ